MRNLPPGGINCGRLFGLKVDLFVVGSIGSDKVTLAGRNHLNSCRKVTWVKAGTGRRTGRRRIHEGSAWLGCRMQAFAMAKEQYYLRRLLT